MNFNFNIKQSKLVAAYLVGSHLLAAICLLNTSVPVNIVIILSGLLLCSFYYQLNRWKFDRYHLIFKPLTNHWQLTKNQQSKKQFNQLRTVYLNSAFIWIILSSTIHGRQSLILGVDSLSEEEYRQIRRYIISPELFK